MLTKYKVWSQVFFFHPTPNSFYHSTARLLMNALKMRERYSCLATSIGKISYLHLPSHFTPDLPIWDFRKKIWDFRKTLFVPNLISFLFTMQVYQITREMAVSSRALSIMKTLPLQMQLSMAFLSAWSM